MATRIHIDCNYSQMHTGTITHLAACLMFGRHSSDFRSAFVKNIVNQRIFNRANRDNNSNRIFLYCEKFATSAAMGLLCS